MTGNIEVLRRLLASRNKPLYSFTLWLKGSKDSLGFEKQLKKKFGRDPSAEISFGYDAGVIAAETLNRVKGDFSKDSIYRAFLENPCFKNTSSGDICFGTSGGHPTRQVYFVQFHKNGGFLPVKR